MGSEARGALSEMSELNQFPTNVVSPRFFAATTSLVFKTHKLRKDNGSVTYWVELKPMDKSH